MVCVDGLMGTDVDIAFVHFPFVKPNDISEPLAYEIFLRRALASGILPHMSNSYQSLVKEYAKYGVASGPGSFSM